MGARKQRTTAAARELRAFALGYPETREDHPWGHSAFKVRNKTFVFMGSDDEGLGLSVKLPHSREEALLLPFTEPTHYGLGKSGWVSARFAPGEEPPLFLLRRWIDESYRAIAPKRLVATLAGAPGVQGSPRRRTSRPVRKKA